MNPSGEKPKKTDKNPQKTVKNKDHGTNRAAALVKEKRAIPMMLILGGLLLSLFVLDLSIGSAHLGFFDTVAALFGRGEASAVLIVRRLRLCRSLTAILAGAGLALAGGVMQITLQNPMASPSTLGVSGAAVFGANFAIIVLGAGAYSSSAADGFGVTHPYLVSLTAFLFAALTAGLLLFVSAVLRLPPETVVLAGVAIGSLFSAGVTMVQYFASDTALASAVFWSFGDLGRTDFSDLLILLVTVAVSFLYFFMRRFALGALGGGDDFARSIGVRVTGVRIASLFFASLITGVSVSLIGTIGFVGLIAPQAIRRLVDDSPRLVLPAGALLGSDLLLLADILSRSILRGIALPVGAITSLIGAPVFLYLLLSRKDRRYGKDA